MGSSESEGRRRVAESRPYRFAIPTNCLRSVVDCIRKLILDTVSERAYIGSSSRSPRASPETSQSRSGTRRPAGWLATMPPGGARATPPIRHYERIVRTHQCEAGGHRRARQRPKGLPRRARSQKTAAVERREASIPGARTAQAALRGMQGATSRACGPALLAREGCLASTRAAVGAPPPHMRGGELPQTSEDIWPRGNDDA